MLEDPEKAISDIRLSIKKSLFPVQRVAEMMASRAAAKFFTPTFFLFDRKILSIFGNLFFVAKMKKKVSSRTLFSSPAASPDT